jgi:transglutaminase-like putative cysteine protease
MMFRPRESHDLRLLKTRLEINPKPAYLRFLHDVFDNSVGVATFEGSTRELRFESVVTLEHFETALPDYPLEESAKRYPFKYSDEECHNLTRALEHHYPNDQVNEWVKHFLDASGNTDTMGLLTAMNLAIRQDFVYTRRTAKGVQTPAETLETRRGSCRDFAVLMMEATRSLGLAARFVSGYIFIPGVGERKMTGGGATHAWMQIYLPGAGWLDFCPTNSIVGNRNLIRVAVAWDHKHVLPLWGTYLGAASSFLGMDVTVCVTEDDPAATASTRV